MSRTSRVVDIKLNIDVQKYKKSGQYDCSNDLFDDCFEQSFARNMTNFCLLPFMTSNLTTNPPCLNQEEGEKALKNFQEYASRCPAPCVQDQIVITENSIEELYEATHPAALISSANYVIKIKLPETTDIMTMKEYYSFESYVADFGGFSGLFLGFSFLGIMAAIKPTCKKIST